MICDHYPDNVPMKYAKSPYPPRSCKKGNQMSFHMGIQPIHYTDMDDAEPHGGFNPIGECEDYKEIE